MFDIGWSELMVIGVVALIVVGPKDLPGMFRTLGKFTAKAKSMAREFTRAMEDAADEAGVKDVAKGLKDATNPTKMGLNKIKEAADEFTNWDPDDESDSAPAKLSKERAEAAKKIQKATAEKAQARLDREAAKAVKTAEAVAKPAAKKPAVKKPAAKKPAAKNPAAKKPTPKKPTVKKPAARKPVGRKPAKGAPK